MKTLTLALMILVMTNVAYALDRLSASQLLEQKNVSLSTLENSGSKLLLGEITGAGRSVPTNKVEVIFIRSEAILKNEIESIDGNTLSTIQSFRAKGVYFLNSDIQGVVLKK